MTTMAGRVEPLDSELEKLNVQIGQVEIDITAVEQKIDNVEKELSRQENQTEKDYLRKEKEQLRKEKEQLRKEKEQLRRKEELLIQERILLLSGPGEPGKGGASFQDFAEEVLEFVRQNSKKSRSKRFSECGTEEAVRLLRRLSLREEKGNELYPIEVPVNTHESEVFDYSNYATEDEGTAALAEHHKKQLAALGIRFGQGGLQVYDLHKETAASLSFNMHSGSDVLKYSGLLDAGIAPFGLYSATAVTQLRMAYEHKQPSEQRNANRRSRGHDVECSTPGKPLARYKGQAVVEILAAYALNNFPLMLDLTDGQTHFLFQLIDNRLVVWEKLGPTEAYYKQSEVLKSLPGVLYKRELSEKHLDQLPEEHASPLKRLKQYSHQSSEGLLDQLEYVKFLPLEDRVAETLRWIQSLGEPIGPMPEAVQAWYG